MSPPSGKVLSERLTSQFKLLDVSDTGQIQVDHLAQVLAAFGVSAEDTRVLLRHSGVIAGDGSVEYSKFFDWLCFTYQANDDAIEAIIDPPLLPQGEHSEQQLSEWKHKYTDIDAIFEALRTGDTVLVKGTWLVEFARSGKTLPRRQDLPSEAIWDVEEHQHTVPTNRTTARNLANDAILAALSYCWATPGHPDPTGEQIRRVARAIELLLWRVDEVAIFIDWCSLYQAPRSDEEAVSFKRALRNVNLWYAHELVFSLLLTVVPDGVKAYMERGWPSFEYAISGLTKSDRMFLDLAGIPPEGPPRFKDFDDFFDKVLLPCRMKRPAPCTPANFRRKLDALHFTNGADRAFVMKKYLSTFEEVMTSAKSFELTNLDWNTEQGKDLAASLPWCIGLAFIDVTYSVISPEGVRYVAEALKHCPTLKTLDLQGCDVGDEGVKHLIAVLHETGLENLFLAENEITDASAVLFAEELQREGCKLSELSLRGNNVTDVGAARLAEAIQAKGCPLTLLRLSENTSITDFSIKLLAEAAKENTNFRWLDLRKVTVGTAAQECLDAVAKGRPGFTVQQ